MLRSAVYAVVVSVAALGAAPAEEAGASRRPERPYPSGTFSHGDSGDFVEDAYGGQVEPRPRDEEIASRKHDPAIRWNAPGGR